MSIRSSLIFGAALLFGCGKSFDAFATLDGEESKALDQLLADAGLDRKALEGDEPKASVSMAGGHINRLVLEAPPSPPSLRSLTAFGSLESMQLVRAITTLDTLPEDCTLVELRLASNGITDLAPLQRCGSLQRLWIVDEKIDSLKTLPVLPKLEQLYVDQVPLSSLHGVGGRERLDTLAVTNAGLKTLVGLEKLPALKTLDVSNNALSDASALDDLASLQDVDVADNALKSFPEVVLAAKVPKIGGNPGAHSVRDAQSKAGLKAHSDRLRAERKLDLGHTVPRIKGTARRVSRQVSWAGNEVEGRGSIERLGGVTIVKLREYDVLELTGTKRRPADRRMTFTVRKGPVRVYFGSGPGTAASVLVEPGTPRIIRTGLAWGDRWTGFIVEAIEGEAQGFAYTLEDT